VDHFPSGVLVYFPSGVPKLRAFVKLQGDKERQYCAATCGQ
jgi:hypothetical protein